MISRHCEERPRRSNLTAIKEIASLLSQWQNPDFLRSYVWSNLKWPKVLKVKIFCLFYYSIELSQKMANSGHTSSQKWHPTQANGSATNGGWYPFLLNSSDIFKTWRGQYSTQRPHPLHRISITWILAGGVSFSSQSRGFLHIFMVMTLFIEPLSLVPFSRISGS